MLQTFLEYRDYLPNFISGEASILSAHEVGDNGPHGVFELVELDESDDLREQKLVDLIVEDCGFRHGGETLVGVLVSLWCFCGGSGV